MIQVRALEDARVPPYKFLMVMVRGVSSKASWVNDQVLQITPL